MKIGIKKQLKIIVINNEFSMTWRFFMRNNIKKMEKNKSKNKIERNVLVHRKVLQYTVWILKIIEVNYQPDPEQLGSTSMYCTPGKSFSVQVKTSLFTVVAQVAPDASIILFNVSKRLGSLSTAYTVPSLFITAATWVVFMPGAEHISRTTLPGGGAKMCTGRQLA